MRLFGTFVCVLACAALTCPFSRADEPTLKLGHIGHLHGVKTPAPVETAPHLPTGGELFIDDSSAAEQVYALLLDKIFAREQGPQDATLVATEIKCEETRGATPEETGPASCQTLVDGNATPVAAATAKALVSQFRWLRLPVVAESKAALQWQFQFIRCTKTVVDPPAGQVIPSMTYACRFRIPSDREVSR